MGSFRPQAFRLDEGDKRSRSVDFLLEYVMRLPRDQEFSVTVERFYEPASSAKLRMLNAHIRDIARHNYGAMTVPERVFDRLVIKVKYMKVNGADIWPRYTDPEPDPLTGETLYYPKSRKHLNNAEAQGIIEWLTMHMINHNIPSNAPTAEYA